MRVLLVAATRAEVVPVIAALSGAVEQPRLVHGRRGGHEVDVLVTGVGMVATAVWCARALAATPYDVAVNLGVCGSFTARMPPGSVVHVTRDSLPELGAEDGAAFLPAQALGLLGADEFPFTNGHLVATAPAMLPTLAALPEAVGITVNTVHGAEASIADITARVSPDVESMEGAAFLYACLAAGVPCAQVRAVSNRVERRNRAAWMLPEAIDALGRVAVAMLESA